MKLTSRSAFTIVELLIVVVVIAILAAITVVAYNGVTGQAKEAALKSDLRTAATELELIRIESNTFPSSYTPKVSDGTTMTYTGGGASFCISATHTSFSNKVFSITQEGVIKNEPCEATPLAMQSLTNATCPVARTMAFDARDNHSYWIQKMPDGKCWMLTNLAYGGGGNGQYADTKTLTDSTNGYVVEDCYENPASCTAAGNTARYFAPPQANPTIYPNQPSLSQDGGVTNPQFGYLYNWCAAMGNQQGTDACSYGVDTTDPDSTISICPAGWSIPGGSGNQVWSETSFGILLNSINALGSPGTETGNGSDNSEAGSNLRSVWLGQYGGQWFNGFTLGTEEEGGGAGFYWSFPQTSLSQASSLIFSGPAVYPIFSEEKIYGLSVRCMINTP